MRGLTMCGDAPLEKAIGIETESTKRAGRSEAGLVVNSPGRMHCLRHLPLYKPKQMRLYCLEIENIM
jgi:hypothetical protein